MRGWEHSPPHRKNLLDAGLEQIGVGVAYSPDTGRYYAVQDFGRPKADAIVFTIADETSQTVHYNIDGKDYSIQPRYTMTHETCRPPTVTFTLPGATDSPAEYHPHRGSHYVIHVNGQRRYAVTEE